MNYFAVVLLSGGVFVVASVITLIIAFSIRRRRQRQVRRRRETESEYRDLFFQWIFEGGAEMTPPADEEEWLWMLSLWSKLYQLVGPSEREGLRGAAGFLGMVEVARTFTNGQRTEYVLCGVKVLGQLQDEESIESIESLTDADEPILKLQALRTLSRIDARAGIRRITENLLRDPNSPLSYYIAFCRDMDPEVWTSFLLEKLKSIPPDQEARLIPLLRAAPSGDVLPFVRRRVRKNNRPEAQSEYLKIFRQIGCSGDQKFVEPFLEHDVFFVRVQAANALGEIGTRLTRDSLIQTLKDRNWWVRLRSAQALVKNPSVDEVWLIELLDRLEDPYARGALKQAMSA